MEIPDSIPGLINIALSVGFGLLLKDLLGSFIPGMLFYLNPFFTEGDVVLLNGEECIITRIGLRTTVFSRQDKNHKTVWRIVQNDLLKWEKLEKVIKEESLQKDWEEK